MEPVLPIASMRVEGFNRTPSIPCLPPYDFCRFEIPGFTIVVRRCCRRDADLCLARTNVGTEAFLLQVALYPDDEGGGGDEGFVRCCCEPSAGIVAEPLPVDGCLLVQLWGWGHGATWAAHPPPGGI